MMSCTGSYEEWEGKNPYGPNPPQPGGQGDGPFTATIGDLTKFEIAVDSTALDEHETINPDDEDYVENNTFDTEIHINYDMSSVTISGQAEGVTIKNDGGHVVVKSSARGINYRLTGYTGDGSLKIYSDYKYCLTLDGVGINNPDGAAINSQCKKRTYLVLADGKYNDLSDGMVYQIPEGEDMKGTLFAEGKLLISGKGHLNVEANSKAGIASDDYILFRPGVMIYVESIAGNCIKANDGIIMRGGVVNVVSAAIAAKGLSSDAGVNIEGGRLVAITSGDAEYDKEEKDLKAAAAIKADSTINISGGDIHLKSTGSGGKGISTDKDLIVDNGSIDIITTGTQYSYHADTKSAKGIKADGNISINNGRIRVRATGGDGSEGIEAKGSLSIAGGSTEVYAYDDAINAIAQINISGGQVFTYAINNDAIDCNGNITIADGTVVACGTSQPESGIDCDQHTLAITGGTVMAIGGGASVPSVDASSQPSLVVGGKSITAGTYVALYGADGNCAFAFRVPRPYGTCAMLVSSPALRLDAACALNAGVTVTEGPDFDGFMASADASGGHALASLTLTSMVTKVNFDDATGGEQPGGQPGEQPGEQPGGQDNPPGNEQ